MSPVPIVIPVAIGLAIGHAAMAVAAAGVWVSWTNVLTIGVRELPRAAAGIGGHRLRHGRAGQHGRRNCRSSEEFDVHGCLAPVLIERGLKHQSAGRSAETGRISRFDSQTDVSTRRNPGAKPAPLTVH